MGAVKGRRNSRKSQQKLAGGSFLVGGRLSGVGWDGRGQRGPPAPPTEGGLTVLCCFYIRIVSDGKQKPLLAELKLTSRRDRQQFA